MRIGHSLPAASSASAATLAASLLAVAVAAAVASSPVGVIETDEAGALHVNSSDPLTQPVFLNGHDVLSVAAAQASMIAEQTSVFSGLESTLSRLRQRNTEQSREIAALKQRACALQVPSLESIPGAGAAEFKWSSGVLAPNGLIYGVPYSTTSVLIIDPATNTLDTTTIAGLPFGASQWHGGLLAPNNNVIYGFPENYDSGGQPNSACPPRHDIKV